MQGGPSIVNINHVRYPVHLPSFVPEQIKPLGEFFIGVQEKGKWVDG